VSGEQITCVECGRTFVWSYGEQRFYKERGLSPPKRCRDCREQHRQEDASTPRTSDKTPLRTYSTTDKKWQAAVRNTRAIDDQQRNDHRWNELLSQSQRSGDRRPRSVRPIPALKWQYRRWWRDATYRYSTIAFGIAILATLLIASRFALDGLLTWFLVINVVTLCTYGYDKQIAGAAWTRVPESVLLALGFAGGTIGALLGMSLFRHKTIKGSFRVKFVLVMLAQLMLLGAYVIFIRLR
jgi:uncharacterized membrane protein YsdA (DUF1294 family)